MNFSQTKTDGETVARRRVQVGCQGWNYDDWVTPHAGTRSIFYPRGTRAEEMLAPLANRGHVSLALIEGPWATRDRIWRAAAPLLDATDFAYLRWMGARDLTRFDEIIRPRDANLQKWAAAIERLRERVPQVFAYFSNFYEGHAPASANKLKRLLGQDTVEPEDLENQPSLF